MLLWHHLWHNTTLLLFSSHVHLWYVLTRFSVASIHSGCFSLKSIVKLLWHNSTRFMLRLFFGTPVTIYNLITVAFINHKRSKLQQYSIKLHNIKQNSPSTRLLHLLLYIWDNFQLIRLWFSMTGNKTLHIYFSSRMETREPWLNMTSTHAILHWCNVSVLNLQRANNQLFGSSYRTYFTVPFLIC